MAVKLLDWLLKRVPPNSIPAPSGKHRHLYITLTERLIDLTVQCSIDSERKRGFRLVTSLLQVLRQHARFKVLESLLDSCPYPAIHGLLVHRLKEEINAVWLRPGESPFFSTSVWKLCSKMLDIKYANPQNAFDVVMNVLNLFRFILLKETARIKQLGTDYRPISFSMPEIHRAKKEYLEPLAEFFEKDVYDLRKKMEGAPAAPQTFSREHQLGACTGMIRPSFVTAPDGSVQISVQGKDGQAMEVDTETKRQMEMRSMSMRLMDVYMAQDVLSRTFELADGLLATKAYADGGT